MTDPNTLKGGVEVVTDRAAGFEALKHIPGTDPVLAVLNERREAIPTSGYWVRAEVAPAICGVVTVIRYEEGALDIAPYVSDDRSEHGQAQISVQFNGYDRHIVAIEEPGFAGRHVEPYNRGPFAWTGLPFDRTDLIDLRNGGRLLDERRPLQVHKGGINFQGWYEDVDVRSTGYGYGMRLERATADEAELQGILAGLGHAMGLDATDAATLVNTVGAKIGYDRPVSAAHVSQMIIAASQESNATSEQPAARRGLAGYILRLLRIR